MHINVTEKTCYVRSMTFDFRAEKLGSMSASEKMRTTPPLTQQQSTDNNSGLKLDKGRGRCVVA